MAIAHDLGGMAEVADFFLRTPTLTTSNFVALWPRDPKFLAVKDLKPFSTVSKVQEASRILRMGFDLSKLPHLLHKMGFVDSLKHATVFLSKVKS